MKILDLTKLGLTPAEAKAIRYSLMFCNFTDTEQHLKHEEYTIDYWLHTIPNVQEDTIKVARVSCI